MLDNKDNRFLVYSISVSHLMFVCVTYAMAALWNKHCQRMTQCHPQVALLILSHIWTAHMSWTWTEALGSLFSTSTQSTRPRILCEKNAQTGLSVEICVLTQILRFIHEYVYVDARGFSLTMPFSTVLPVNTFYLHDIVSNFLTIHSLTSKYSIVSWASLNSLVKFGSTFLKSCGKIRKHNN